VYIYIIQHVHWVVIKKQVNIKINFVRIYNIIYIVYNIYRRIYNKYTNLIVKMFLKIYLVNWFGILIKLKCL